MRNRARYFKDLNIGDRYSVYRFEFEKTGPRKGINLHTGIEVDVDPYFVVAKILEENSNA